MNVEFLSKMQAEFTRRCGPCVIAGGCVRDVLLAARNNVLSAEPKDYDIFVFNDGKKMTGAEFEGLERITTAEWHKSEPFLQATVRYEGVIVQVMSSNFKTLGELLDSFDWNVSRFGFDAGHTLALTSLDDIGEGKMLRLHKVTYPLSTLRRGFRFSERFGMQLDNAELQALCAMVAGRLARFVRKSK